MLKTADAIRAVTARMQKELTEGRRPSEIDAEDLVMLLLAIADEMDPPFPTEPDPQVELLEAARALLEAREDQMVTAREWDRLRRAVETVSSD